jgi:hemolysin III
MTNGHGADVDTSAASTSLATSERENAATAAAGLVAAALAASVLIAIGLRQADGWRLAAALVFGLSLCALHLASTLYHAASEPAIKARLKLFDHCAIYLLIAGTYTPFTLIGLRGPLGWKLFIAIWSLAALGVVFKLFSKGRWRLLSTLIYVAMGWLVMLAIRPVMAALDTWTFGWVLAGGIAYTAGTLFYHRPRMRHSHAVWHLFVIAGGVCHFVAVLAQVGAAS